jgi:ankyrin repeat and BTB/POZ domain-containing protein 1
MIENGHEALFEPNHGLSSGLAARELEAEVSLTCPESQAAGQMLPGDQGLSETVRTLDGEVTGGECATDAGTYQMLLGKIDSLLDRLKLDA